VQIVPVTRWESVLKIGLELLLRPLRLLIGLGRGMCMLWVALVAWLSPSTALVGLRLRPRMWWVRLRLRRSLVPRWRRVVRDDGVAFGLLGWGRTADMLANDISARKAKVDCVKSSLWRSLPAVRLAEALLMAARILIHLADR